MALPIALALVEDRPLAGKDPLHRQAVGGRGLDGGGSSSERPQAPETRRTAASPQRLLQTAHPARPDRRTGTGDGAAGGAIGAAKARGFRSFDSGFRRGGETEQGAEGEGSRCGIRRMRRRSDARSSQENHSHVFCIKRRRWNSA